MEDIEWGRAVPSKGPSVTAGDVYASAIEESRRVSNINARDENLFDAYEDVNGRIKHATGKDVANPFGFNAPVTPVATGGYGYSRFPKQKDPVAEWRRTIADIKNKHPDAMPWDGIENEPERIANERMRATRDATTELHERTGLVDAERIPYLGKVPVARSVAALGVNLATHPQLTVAEFAGGLRGQLYSPVDTFSNLVGFGAGTATDSILKAALKNAIVNASVQVPLSGLKQSDYKQAGLPSGWDVWLSEVEGAAGAGFFLDAGIRAPGRAAIKAFGRDAPAGAMLSRNTERGGWLMDAPDKLDLPPAPVSRPPVEAETMKKAMSGNLDAVREVAEKTGAIEDPAVKGALHYAETTGAIDATTIEFFRAAQIDDGERLRVLQAAMAGGDHVRIPTEITPAKTPLMRDEAATLLATRAQDIEAAIAGLDVRTGRLIRDGIDAGLPDIVKVVRAHLDQPGELGRAVARLAETMGGTQKLADHVTIHSANGGILAVADAMRRSPELVDSNVSLKTDFMLDARAISQLDDAAFVRVMSGDVLPAIASLVSDMVRPELHDRVMSDLTKAGIKDVEAARAAIPDLIPIEKGETPLDGGGSIKEPNDAAAKAQVRRLEVEHAEAMSEAMAPVEARRNVESRIETIKGEISNLEARQDAELGLAPKDEKLDPASEPGANQIGDAVAQVGDALGIDVRPLIEAQSEPAAVKPAITSELRFKRTELDASVAEKAALDARLNGNPDVSPLLRMVLESAALQRSMDVRRAINDALRLARRMLPEGTKVDVVGREMRDPVTGYLVDAFSDVTSGDIALATYAMNPAARLGHEGLHTLVTRGLVSPHEIKLLADMARNEKIGFNDVQYREAYKNRSNIDALIDEEAAAHLIESVIAGKINVDTPSGVVARIKMLVRRVRNALAGYGFQTDSDLARAIVNGDVARRQARQEWMRQQDITAGSVKPDGTLFAFAGERAKTADHAALAEAKKMEMEGKDRTEIWTKTGWFRGVDGKWRFEIDDSGQRLKRPLEDLDKAGRPMPSDLVFQHDKLHEAYPQVGDIPWYRTPEMEAGGGSYDPVRGIRIGSGHGFASGKSGPGGMTLHEQQHALQDIEDFARGGSREYGHPIADVKREAQAAYEANRAHQQSGVRTADDELLAELGLEPPKLTQEWSTLTPRQQLDWYDAGRGRLYNNLAGEVEARTVQKRMDMTPEERRARPPWLDYDVPEDQQIVRGVARSPQEQQALDSVPGSHFPPGTMFALSQGPGRAMDPIDPVQAQAVLLHDFGFRSVKTKGGDNVAVDAVRAARLISEVTGVDAASMGRVLNLRLRSTRGSTNAGSFRGFGRWLGGTVRLDANSSTGSVAVHEFGHAIDQAARNQRVGIGMATEKPNPIDRLFLASTMVPVVNIVTTPVMVAAKLIDRYAFRGRMLADRMRKNYPWMTPRVAQGFADLAAVLEQGKDAAQGRGDAAKTHQAAEDAAFLTMTRTGEAKEKAWNTYRDAKAAAGDVYPYPPEVDAALAKVEKAIDDHAAASKAWAQWTDKRLQPETVFEGSLNADGGQIGSYYSQPSEIFARAFEVYVRDRAERIYTPSQVTAMLGKDSVGPEYARRGGAQREAIGTAFDKIFDGIRANVAAIAAGDKPDTGTLFALRDAETGRSMREDLDALGYYSGALRAAQALRQAKGTPEQMLAMMGKSGAKAGEIEATGLSKFLEGRPSVTRDEIVGHLEQNRLGLKEAQRINAPLAELEKAFQRYDGHTFSQAQNLSNLIGMGRNVPEELSAHPEVQRLGRQVVEAQANSVDAPKWARHSLDPSNPTYRETVLHLPPSFGDWQIEHRPGLNEYVVKNAATDELMTRPGGNTARFGTLAEAEKAMQNSGFGSSFQSGHFPEPNITGHMMTSMARHEGKPVFTLDQIQSDWGQKMRDGGVRDEAKAARLADEIQAKFGDMSEAARTPGHPESNWDHALMERRKLDPERRLEFNRLTSEWNNAKNGAPGHPLVNTTDQWTTTTLRRALRQAVEADADYIAIPHGDTVLSYNPGDEHGMRSFYGDRSSEGIVPKNLRKILSRIDKDGTAPVKVETLETPSGKRGYRPDEQGEFDPDQTGFTVFPLSDKVKAAVVDEGQAMFAIRDDRHGTQGLDMTQNAPPPEPPPPLHTEVAVLDRMSRMTGLVMACR